MKSVGVFKMKRNLVYACRLMNIQDTNEEVAYLRNLLSSKEGWSCLETICNGNIDAAFCAINVSYDSVDKMINVFNANAGCNVFRIVEHTASINNDQRASIYQTGTITLKVINNQLMIRQKWLVEFLKMHEEGIKFKMLMRFLHGPLFNVVCLNRTKLEYPITKQINEMLSVIKINYKRIRFKGDTVVLSYEVRDCCKDEDRMFLCKRVIHGEAHLNYVCRDSSPKSKMFLKKTLANKKDMSVKTLNTFAGAFPLLSYRLSETIDASVSIVNDYEDSYENYQVDRLIKFDKPYNCEVEVSKVLCEDGSLVKTDKDVISTIVINVKLSEVPDNLRLPQIREFVEKCNFNEMAQHAVADYMFSNGRSSSKVLSKFKKLAPMLKAQSMVYDAKNTTMIVTVIRK